MGRDYTWSQFSPKRAPSPRAWHGMTGTKKDVLIFGGGDSRWTYTNDTFFYRSRANKWKKVSFRKDDD